MVTDGGVGVAVWTVTCCGGEGGGGSVAVVVGSVVPSPELPNPLPGPVTY